MDESFIIFSLSYRGGMPRLMPAGVNITGQRSSGKAVNLAANILRRVA
jgi:hypothetical protein